MSRAVPHGLVAAELAADVGSCVIAPPVFKIPAAAGVPATRVVHAFAALVALLPDFHDGDAALIRVAGGERPEFIVEGRAVRRAAAHAFPVPVLAARPPAGAGTGLAREALALELGAREACFGSLVAAVARDDVEIVFVHDVARVRLVIDGGERRAGASTVTVTFARTLRRVMSSVARQAFVGVDVEGGGVAVGTDEGAAVGAAVALPRVASTSSLGQPILPWVSWLYNPRAQMRIAYIDI